MPTCCGVVVVDVIHSTYTTGVAAVDWSHGQEHMWARHGVSVAEATEALADVSRVVVDPDPASRSGASMRVIGWSHSRGELVSVVLVRAEGVLYGASGWRSNATDIRRYGEGDED